MFVWNFEIRINNKLLTARAQRVMNRIMKKALEKALLFWKDKFLKRHFQRTAYSLYPAVYVKRKKTGDPLVVSGHLERTVTNRPGRTSGTAKRITLYLGLGRPVQYHGRQLSAKVVARMATLRKQGVPETYRDARRAILSKAGYNTFLKKYFQKHLSTIRGTEQQAMATVVKKHIVKEMKTEVSQTVETIRIK